MMINQFKPPVLHFDRTVEIIDFYSKQGFVIVSSPFLLEHIDLLKHDIQKLCEFRCASLGVSVADRGRGLDDYYDALVGINRSHGGEVYNVVRDTASFSELVLNKWLKEVAASLMDAKFIQIPFELCTFHIARPFEDKWLFDWHNDYSFNLLARDAVTAWIPLTNTDVSMGSLALIPGSHKTMSRVIVNDPNFKSGNGGGGKVYQIDRPLADMEAEAISVELKVGEVLFFNALLLHRSGSNISKVNRWIVNPRYSDFLDDALLSRGWRSGREADRRPIFQEIHPEWVKV